ncbi:MAG: uroporphyrinogen-III C-methyltransferase, partial [Thiohalomonadales bacterium]
VSLLAETLTSSESNFKNEIKTLTTLQAELSDSVQALLSQSTHMRKDWLVSEAEYLVQLAVNRLTLEEDIKTAIVALTNADARLLEAGDPGLHLLRQEISNTITALKALPVLDVSGISMQISSVIQQINKLPLVTPDPESIKNSQQIAHDKLSEDRPINWKEVTTKVVSDLTSLIRIRKHDQIVQPLLTPEQSFYLTQNLKLQLEQARTALLHKQENTFHERLTESISWIEEYFDKSNTATQSAITILSNLNKIKLTQELPDLSQTLNMFTNFQAGIRLNKKSTKTSTEKKPVKEKPSKKQTETKKKTTTKTKVIELKKEPEEKPKDPEQQPEQSNDQKTLENNKTDLVPVAPEKPGVSL